MANVIAGIKEVFFGSGASALTDMENADFGLGFRQTGQFIGEAFNPIEDHRTRQFGNLFNFRAEFSTMQISTVIFDALIGYAKANAASMVLITSGIQESPSASVVPVTNEGNVFIFDSGDALGVDFELILTPTDRNITVTAERAYGIAAANTLIVDSATNSVAFSSAGTHTIPDLDATQVSTGFLYPDFVSAGGVEVIPQVQLADFRISLATKGNKNAFNTSLVHSIHCEMEATMSGVDNSVLKAMVEQEFPAVDVDIFLDGTNKITIKQLSYSKLGDFEIGDENRNAHFMLMGDLDLDFYDNASAPATLTFNTFLGGF
jgi:hypothetical protein